MKLKPQVKEAYLAALRGEEYKQCRKWTHVGNYFCAVGVLCDLFAHESNIDWIKWDVVYDSGDEIFGLQAPNSPRINPSGLTAPIIEWAFVPASEQDAFDLKYIEQIPITEIETTVAKMNDEGYTLAEIADVVEVYL